MNGKRIKPIANAQGSAFSPSIHPSAISAGLSGKLDDSLCGLYAHLHDYLTQCVHPDREKLFWEALLQLVPNNRKTCLLESIPPSLVGPDERRARQSALRLR
jgi:hypothetical protein